MREVLRLRRILELPAKPAVRPTPKCELCNAAMGEQHSHIVDMDAHRLLCSCRPCYLLFVHPGAAQGRYRSVGERYLRLAPSSVDWDMFDLPAGIAFFLRSSSPDRIMAFYPSPGGATESGVSLEAWDEVVRASPEIASLERDVEALLVNHRRGCDEAWIVPIDACYELVGRIRRCWRGFDGGDEAKQEIDGFFAELQQRDGWTCST